MPLHLLGKKSWNVYNADNIARVRHDEALAAAREAEEEQRMQEVDAERRLTILRGQQLPPPPPAEEQVTEHALRREKRSRDVGGRENKRRRLAGEDDTDRDMRLALQRNDEGAKAAMEMAKSQGQKRSSDAPLTDRDGHINLFPIDPRVKRKDQKNAEAEAEAAKKKREFEDQYTMRFSNAAGHKQDMDKKPWYAGAVHSHSGTREGAEVGDSNDWDMVGKDAWGNEDPRRREREKTRLNASDPMAAMQKAQRQLKDVKQDRRRWEEERAREVQDLEDRRRRERRRIYYSERHREKNHSHREDIHARIENDDEIEAFMLDPASKTEHEDRHRKTVLKTSSDGKDRSTNRNRLSGGTSTGERWRQQGTGPDVNRERENHVRRGVFA